MGGNVGLHAAWWALKAMQQLNLPVEQLAGGAHCIVRQQENRGTLGDNLVEIRCQSDSVQSTMLCSEAWVKCI